MNLNSIFDLGQQVGSPDGLRGTVTDINFSVRSPGPMYLVRWRDNDGGLCEFWFAEAELTG